MKKEIKKMLLAVLWALTAIGIIAAPSTAQTAEVKEKPPMYSYISNWTIPRAQWGEMEKNNATDEKILEKALAAGTIIAYGNDTNLVHQPEGTTHDNWWSASSMAALLNVLDQFYKTGTATAPVLTTATRHHDSIFVSRYYNWHAGSYKDVYTHVGAFRLRADAPNDAVDVLSKSLMVPLFEKMLADGAIHEYEIDTETIHTEAPGMFLIVYVASSAEGLDKVNAAVQQMLKASPLTGPAFGSMTESAAHTAMSCSVRTRPSSSRTGTVRRPPRLLTAHAGRRHPPALIPGAS